jgi:2-dehydropantoate 2-reductase
MVYREAAQVASMERVSIPNEMEFETRLRQVLETTSDNTCSMLQDINAGRRTEIDALNQAVANLGEEHGLRMPLNHLLAVLVQACHP